MERDETLVEIVKRLETATTRLETLMDGNPNLGITGIRTNLEALENRVSALESSQRPSVSQWLMGYTLFVVAFGMTIKEMRDYLGLSPLAAMVLGAVFIAAAAVMFISGLGWFKWR